mgnify:FL=1|jgi:D-3-phosphoglycerate dehydrogenase|tara:strand:+ start:5251 stop:6165 length:915 start_codon:yes stop_codon:yes gene_type:complete
MEYFKNKILIISPVHPYLISELKRLKHNVEYFPSIKYIDLEKKIASQKLLILRSGIKIDKNIINKAKKLKYIIRAGSGLDNIDVTTAIKNNIKVFNLPNLNAVSVAEFAFGLIISAARNIVKADKELRKNIWNKPSHYGFQLKDKTLGIIGLGNIGTNIAKIAKGFSMNVIANVKNQSKKRTSSVKLVSLHNLLKNSDFITLNVPLKNDTKNLLNKKNCRLLRKNSILVNLSRGGVVNEEVLYRLLKDKLIFRAATDVFLHEKKDNKLFKLENIIVTPHIGAMTYDAQKNIANEVIKKVIKLKI